MTRHWRNARWRIDSTRFPPGRHTGPSRLFPPARLTDGVGRLGPSAGRLLVDPGLPSRRHQRNIRSAGGSIGTVVADEPQAALVGHDVLARGGNAADAATATALALGVTLPSRASFGGGGACLVSRPGEVAQSITFQTRAGTSKGADRPAATPADFRGLYLMQLHYGTVDFNDLIAPALNLASTGITVSRTLAADLAAVRPALLADDGARAIFGRGDASTLVAGDSLAQPRLAGFLERIRVAGVGDLYNGALADVYVTAAQKAGVA